ncbi:hypothetical protein PBK173_000517400 [Plasmodium berghei]|uniref:Uncharacterized protein n=1 Tax=Plasmodium berghei TaxID=5821 RepID=A0A113PCS4_PLABE|nr:hypothetical protein PBK173_000517400 [Plasmodium berghei]
MNNGIRALYVYNSSPTSSNLIYTKIFVNIEVYAKSLQVSSFYSILCDIEQ